MEQWLYFILVKCKRFTLHYVVPEQLAMTFESQGGIGSFWMICYHGHQIYRTVFERTDNQGCREAALNFCRYSLLSMYFNDRQIYFLKIKRVCEIICWFFLKKTLDNSSFSIFVEIIMF